MNLYNDNVIGIVGGMGPKAGIALMDTITSLTDATTDQQHFSTILMSFPKYIADRTLFLEGHELENPAFNIAEVILKLESAGARIAGIACNTAHAPDIYNVIVKRLQKTNSRIRLLHMPLETCMHLKRNYPHVRNVGIMATNGTYKSGVYKTWLAQLGYKLIINNHAIQNDVIHRMIYDPDFGIKVRSEKVRGEVKQLIDRGFQFFKEKEADAVIIGCTELSLAISEGVMNDIIVVDSSRSLARALIREGQLIIHSANCTTPQYLWNPTTNTYSLETLGA